MGIPALRESVQILKEIKLICSLMLLVDSDNKSNGKLISGYADEKRSGGKKYIIKVYSLLEN